MKIKIYLLLHSIICVSSSSAWWNRQSDEKYSQRIRASEDEDGEGPQQFSLINNNNNNFNHNFNYNNHSLIQNQNFNSFSLSQSQSQTSQSLNYHHQQQHPQLPPSPSGRRRGQRQRQNKHGLRLLADAGAQGGGAWPPVFNVTERATATANATCGQAGKEMYCKMVDAHPHKSRAPQCGVCDDSSSDPDKRHPISHAIDGTNRWWQSPVLEQGKEYEQVTITLDLGQVFEILHVMMKSAISPRPASWVLEKSLDGIEYTPWQFFAASEEDCLNRFNLTAQTQNYVFESDSEVICTTQFSKVIPLENGLIQVSLTNSRPGVNSSSTELLNFTLTRYIRFRLLSMHTSEQTENNIRWLVDQQALEKRSFYSIRTIKLEGRCFCSGHAAKCHSGKNELVEEEDIPLKCNCLHNTCGDNCEKCCPLYNQRPFRLGTSLSENKCEKCECHGHAVECRYSPDIEERGLSMNVRGKMFGGGVCINCTKFTTGINCEKCLPNYYRPYDRPPDAETPCVPCECDTPGSIGDCNPFGGDCVCKENFIGPKCTVCAAGYRGENCTKCTCDRRGTMPGGECESHCQCKLHVEGEHCDRCSPGYFSLSADNPEGCLKCFCSGVGLHCKASEIESSSYATLENWTVTDIAKLVSANPTRDNNTGNMVFGNYELPDVEAVYWSAPENYLGNRLTSYGSHLIFKLIWDVDRGDTSGKPTRGPNVILIGRNKMKIAFGDDTFLTKNATIDILLTETGWYHVPNTVKDIITRLRRTDYKGDPVTRVQFMSVLTYVDSILLRGTFHTDQLETTLEKTTLYTGTKDENDHNYVEQCECPPGYSGLSCETCTFGHLRIFENTTTHERIGKCLPCGCNGHAATCDVLSGKCGECLHNTFGERCERCLPGFFGNALNGNENDCVRCACPLLESSNNFSPNCQLRDSNVSSEYICTQCPDGHTGNHCELCDDGYYGSPTVLDSKCLPCPCDGNPCDPSTGECITCLGNTEGWRCERCKTGFWGDPKTGCEICDCFRNGSISNVCDSISGQCVCKPRFTGHRCDQCEIGYANITLECPACQCNANGSENIICDRYTGQCECKANVEGLKCDKCNDLYFGLSPEGCEVCNCHINGAEQKYCNHKTGQCKCRPNVEGRRCDACRQGYFDIDSKIGCRKCECDALGSEHSVCDIYSGQCSCKPGVEDVHCDRCMPGYYGLSTHGCKKCELCTSPAYVCDPDTGRCVCPPMSHGKECMTCLPNTWGWEFQKGCKHCECDRTGAIGQSCNMTSGQCECKEGYAGRQCDECARGYYGYPNCKKCGCDPGGSKKSADGIIDCDDNGQCLCKYFVHGTKCEHCRQATFGLAESNPDGCTPCFCFGRSQDCRQSDLSWGQFRMPHSRNLSVEYLSFDPNRNERQENAYVRLIQMDGPKVRYDDEVEMHTRHGLYVLPGHSGHVILGRHDNLRYPLYFELPKLFNDDRTMSYGGYLNFSLTTEGHSDLLIDNVLKQFPLVRLHTHDHLILDYFGAEVTDTPEEFSTSVHLHETAWRWDHRNITREILMSALQNVRHIYIRGTSSRHLTRVVLSNVTLDNAIYISGATNHAALGVEFCSCDSKYSGYSCQDPGQGYYRWKNETVDGVLNINVFIGHVAPCECNGRSEDCDKETGHCLDCKDNTGGNNCEKCAEGYYGDPFGAGCAPCPCPETRKNFAKGCSVDGSNVNCICREGYAGRLCDRCATGFFGNAMQNDGFCEACDCNSEGTIGEGCDEHTGQCVCMQGVTGRKCDRCEAPRHILKDYKCTMCDNCTLTLLDKVDDMKSLLAENVANFFEDGIPAPWNELDNYKEEVSYLAHRFHDFNRTKNFLQRSFDDSIIEKLQSKANNINSKINKFYNKADKRNHEASKLKNEAEDIRMDLQQMMDEIEKIIVHLNSFFPNEQHINLSNSLRKAQEYLEDIRNMFSKFPTGQEELNCAHEHYLTWTKEMNVANNMHDFYNTIEDETGGIKFRLDDLRNHSHNVFKTVTETQGIQSKNIELFNKLLEDYKTIDTMRMDIDDMVENNLLFETEKLMHKINESLNKIDPNLKRKVNDLDGQIEDNEIALNDLSLEIVTKAQMHAEGLEKQSRHYSSLFQNTRDGAEAALKASTAHKNITAAIEAALEAAKTAEVAASKTYAVLYPLEGATIADNSSESVQESRRLEEAALIEIEKLDELEDKLSRNEKIVEKAGRTIYQSALDNNAISMNLTNLMDGAAVAEIKNVIDVAKKLSGQMKEVRGDAVKISQDVYGLKMKLSKLEPDMDSKFGLAEENITQSLRDIRKANSTLHHNEILANKTNENFKLANSSLSSNLQKLRDNIARARHAAEGISISIVHSDNDSEKCIRSYLPLSYEPTTSTTISMSIALNKETANSPLLFIEGENGKFIALEMYQEKIRLIWRLGNETQTITHPTKIKKDDNLRKDSAWYYINVDRTLNIASLRVRQNGDTNPVRAAVDGASTPEFTRLTFNPSNRVWVGGVPDNIRPAELMAANGLGVAVHELSIDQRHIGLWNFATSEKCDGAVLGAQENIGSSDMRHFNGEGYAVINTTSLNKSNRRYFHLTMDIKTWDKDALLFLAVEQENNRSISLTLHEGKVKFTVDYGNNIKLEIITKEPVNNGKRVNIDVSKQFQNNQEHGQLTVDGNSITLSPESPITSIMLVPDISKSLYYLGGIPPGFKSNTTKASGADHSFLGCMSGISVNTVNIDPLDSTVYFGVEATCKNLITTAGFYGNGYVELDNSHSLKKRANFGFVFRSLQPTCLLLFSAYPPDVIAKNAYDEKENFGNYSVALVDGRVNVWMQSLNGRIELFSNITYNDGEYHSIIVTKQGRRFELRVDDEFQMSKSFSQNVIVAMPENDGGLYIGGAPDYQSFSQLSSTTIPLMGTVKDIFFNNKTISFDDARYSANVHLGRTGPAMGSKGISNIFMKTEPLGTSFKPVTEGCHRVGGFSYEPNAFKFGDGFFSHSIINVPHRNFWQRNFNIQFDFRTFYPNGVLFVSPGSKAKPKHFIVFTLRDGALSLIVRGRRRQDLSLPIKLNDGKWHHVTLNCFDRKATLAVDMARGKANSAQMKLPKKLSASNMFFVGGIPEGNFNLPNELMSKLVEFKGCVRRFNINNQTQDLASPGRHQHVGQCFPRVEKGSYFPGDAYAIYKKQFKVEKLLELELEFRTSELNGILISVADPVGYSGLSMELYNGNVVMSCDLGDGNIFRVETELPSKYALCDNRWHNITALYEGEQIAIRIDQQPMRTILTQSRASGKVYIGPLYIGGIPDTATSGTLLMRENFKGCIKNVAIRNDVEILDWTDMDSLHNVLLSECLTLN